MKQIIYLIQKNEKISFRLRKKYHENNSSIRRAKQKRLVIIANCTNCSKKKSKFIKNKEASRFLSDLRNRTPLRKVPLISDIIF